MARVFRLLLFAFVAVAGIGVWVYFTAWQTLRPGEAAVILRLGEFDRIRTQEGFFVHLPYPIETREVLNVGASQRREFGSVDASEGVAFTESIMQTGDQNIVQVEFVVQYRIGNPFLYRYRGNAVDKLLRDGAQAAMREVVGRNTIDGVLSERRGVVAAEAADQLQAIMDRYETGLLIENVELQEVQPPAAVREAFDDVIAANQDRNRQINEAEGYANEILPRARAQAGEIAAEAAAYRDAKIAQARGDAERFLAIVAEYDKAPEITRTRLYLETMERVLPKVNKVIVEPGAATVLPYLPLPGGGTASAPAAPAPGVAR
ncbi:MAG: FtsH protease activity modulator HflK [Myxococcota bacterium]|nr:FtsH protease activity modulator HflK [Myxococcota bacterium]